MILNFVLIIIGFILLIKCADFLVDGASEIAKKFHIPEIVIGLTIVSIGTSMPELVVSVKAALDGHTSIAIGNVVGSNLANMFLILGVCAIIRPLEFKRETRIFENPFTMFVTAVLFLICKSGVQIDFISRAEGSFLLLLFILFIIYNIIMADKGEKFDLEKNTIVTIKVDEQKNSIFKSIIYIIIGIIGLKVGGDLVVNNAEEIATRMGITEKMISLTIVAFSTSLPELITSITATRKGEADMAIGNVLGSQILNIVLIIGFVATIHPINYSIEYDKDIIILLAGTILLSLFPYLGEKNKMTRGNGISFFLIYVIYMCSLVLFGR